MQNRKRQRKVTKLISKSRQSWISLIGLWETRPSILNLALLLIWQCSLHVWQMIFQV